MTDMKQAHIDLEKMKNPNFAATHPLEKCADKME